MAAVAQALNPAPRPQDFVIEAQNSIRVQTGATLDGGDLGARGTGSGPFLANGVAIDVGAGVVVPSTRNLIADSIRLGVGARVGDLQTNRFVDGGGTTHGPVSALVALPALPAASAVVPGTSNLTVTAGTTVTASPGRRAIVSVGAAGRLRLQAGLYEFGSLSLAASARLEALGAVVVRVAGRLSALDGTFIVAAPGVTLSAKDIRIEVSGLNGTTGALTATPKAASIGGAAQVRALLLVPNGTLTLGGALTGTGAFFARDVDVGAGAELTFQDGFVGGCSDAASCNDDNPCTTDACNAGTCSNTLVAAGTSCSDGNACNGSETCSAAGSCTAGTPVTCTALDQCHSAGTCNPATGTCSTPFQPDGTSCDDGNPGTIADACTAGTCAGREPCAGVTCTALDDCHAPGTCDPATGLCSNPVLSDGTACDDGDACTASGACSAGTCVGANPTLCFAIDPCHVSGVCDPSTGACSNPPAPDGTACNDLNANTVTDICMSGTCAGVDHCAGVTCVASDQCHEPDCDHATGQCFDRPKIVGTPCNDGNACTTGDACLSGTCVGQSPVLCAAPGVCRTEGVCNPQTGVCSDPIAADGTGCDDGDPDTVADVCTSGLCAGVDRCAGVSCASTDPCKQAGVCDPVTGLCSNPPSPDGTACNDGNACTTSDTCVAGLCTGAEPVVCPALDACHEQGVCDPATGACSNPNAADGTACSDDNSCTQIDLCQAGVCQGSNAVQCTGSDACHDMGVCDPGTGTCSNPIKPECAVAVHITSPASLITVGSFPIQVTGTVSQPDAVVTLNGIPVQHSGGTFSASVALEEGHNTIVARAVKGSQQATDSIFVSLDLTPPYVTVESHSDGDTLYTDTVTVTGLLNDIVRGTLEQNQVVVTVNGIVAAISNRSYAARDVPLTPGDNTITVLGTDQVGNVGSKQLTLRYSVPQGRRLDVVSGQDQIARIGTIVPNPLVVRVLDDALDPVPNKTVVFRVVHDSGLVGATTADEGRAIAVETDAQGIASTRFRLGARSGVSNQRVIAKVVGWDEKAVFHASALANAGDRIGVNSGNNQRGAVGQQLPDPFVVVVSDDGGNVVQGARVLFEVTAGGGTLTGGEATYETQTDSDGRTTAEYILGPLQGIDAQIVTATLLDTGAETVSAGFHATGFIPGPPGATTISGFVLDNQDNPVPGVTVRALGTTRQAIADAQGQFKITEAPVGPVHLLADGSTATVPGEYPSLAYHLVTVPGVDNPMSAPIYMVKLDTEHAVLAGPTDVALELPDYPGFKFEIAKDGVTFPDGSRSGLISVTSVNSSAVPMVPPNGMQPQFIISVQPANARFDPPAALTIPNLDGYPPGTQTEMYSFDHDLEEFVPIGLGTVSEDGSVIKSNPGVGVVKAGWHSTSRPEERGCTCNCGMCTSCGDKCACVPADGSPGPLAGQDIRGDCRAPECRGGSLITGKDDGDVPEPVAGDCHKVTCYSGSRIRTIDTSDVPPDDKCKRCGPDGSVVPVEVSGGETSVQYTFKPPVDVINRLNQGLMFFERFGVTAQLSLLELSGSLATKKCCDKVHGEGTETTGKVAGDFGGLKIDWQAWPPAGAGSFEYDFERKGLGATVTIEAEFKGGVFFGLSAKVSGELGYRSSGCTGNPEGCGFAKLGTTITLNPRIGIEGAAKLAYSCLFCTGLAINVNLNVTAAQASWPFAISDIAYNAEQCDGQITGGVFQPGPLALNGKATFSGSWSPDGGVNTFQVQEEFTLFSCTYGANGLVCS